MRTMSTTTRCPTCGSAATITITEEATVNTEGHTVDFACVIGCPPVADSVLLLLWAEARSGARRPAATDG